MSEVKNTNRPADAIDCLPAAKSAGDADESSRLPDATKLEQVREALARYHKALDRKQRSDEASWCFVHECETILDQPWQR